MLRIAYGFLFIAAVFYGQTPPGHLTGIYPLPGATGVARNTVFLHSKIADSRFVTTLRTASNPTAAIPVVGVSGDNPLASFGLTLGALLELVFPRCHSLNISVQRTLDKSGGRSYADSVNTYVY